MDSTEKVVDTIFWVGYSAGMNLGQSLFIMVTVCSVVLFIGKLMR